MHVQNTMLVQCGRRFMPKLALAFAVTLGLLAITPAHAQPAGARITVVYPFAAGGAGDGAGRLVSEELGRRLKTGTVFENRGGAGGRIGIRSAVNAPADGTVLLFAPMGPMAIQPSFHPNMGFDAFKDFKAVSMVAAFDLALAAAGNVPVKSLAEAVKWIKANSDKASAGVPGAGGLPHFFTFMLSAAAGIEITPVVYRGSGPAVNDAVAGHLRFLMLPVSESLAQHRAGKLRVLATSGPQRARDLPDVPTFKEAGYDIQGQGWYAMFVPAKTPDNVIDKLSTEIQAILKQSEIINKFRAMGLEPHGTSAAEMTKIHRADFERWAPAVKASGFKPGKQ